MNLFEKNSQPRREKTMQADISSVGVGGQPEYYNASMPNTLDLGWYYNESKNQLQMAKIAQKDRATHLYVIGATGAGKTKFLEFLISQDIQQGVGFGVIDPHGDLIEDIKGMLACRYRNSENEQEISERTILIDPTDPDHTVIFNPLEKLINTSAAEQANELISCFRRIWADSWGVRMEDLLRNALIALGEAGHTLVELPTFLTQKAYRQEILRGVGNPIAWDYFQSFDTLTPRAQLTWIQPVMNKINAFLSDDRIRQMLSAPQSTFNLREIMDQGMILLIKLDKGRLKGAGDLLGSLLMAKLQMAAFSRSDIPQDRRRPFHLYIDEFQNYASDSFQIVLSEARKYGLSLTIAHQTLAQISNELRSLILANAGVQVYFRLNRQDAQLLSREIFEYSGFEVKYFHSHSPNFWSFAEEWEHKTEELQSLQPRLCLAKHKIQGGLLLLHTVDMDPAWKVLGMKEGAYQQYVSQIPFGQKHLIPRSELPNLARKRLPEEVKPSQPERNKPASQPVQTSSPMTILPTDKEQAPVPDREQIATPTGQGKGGRQHQYLQGLIKKMAEENGYRAIIEKPTPDGQGQVDVSLERDDQKIACEVSVTTDGQQELGNVQKCLAAGYDQVILCATDKKSLQKLKKVITQELREADLERVLFLESAELLLHLAQQESTNPVTEQRIKGYKVKVQHQAVTEADEKTRREDIAKVLSDAMRRLQDDQ